MRTLIAAADLDTRYHVSSFASRYGICDNTSNASDALVFFRSAIEDGGPYDAVFLDEACYDSRIISQMRKIEQESKYPEPSNALFYGVNLGCKTPGLTECFPLPITEERFEKITKQITEVLSENKS